jgi:hypothetical protein
MMRQSPESYERDQRMGVPPDLLPVRRLSARPRTASSETNGGLLINR